LRGEIRFPWIPGIDGARSMGSWIIGKTHSRMRRLVDVAARDV
jgi:hypothetical protein